MGETVDLNKFLGLVDAASRLNQHHPISYISRLCRDAVQIAGELGRLREVLENIAKQKTYDEIDVDQLDGCDFESAYDTMIWNARAALPQTTNQRERSGGGGDGSG